MSNIFLNKQNIEEIKNILSIDRYLTFYNLANESDVKAFSLYKENIFLSHRFYTSLHIMEVCLRNKINGLFKECYGNDWVMCKDLPFTNSQINILQQLKEKSLKENVVPLLQLGFWTAFFGREYEEIWRHYLRSLFKVEKVRRGDIGSALKKMRTLRNRIAHHEPIIHLDIKTYEDTCYWLIQMMSPITLQWLKEDLLNPVRD